MPATDTLYVARAQALEYIVRAQDNLLQQPMYDAGALVAPSSGTLSVYDSSGTVVLDGVVASITGSIAQYTMPAASAPATMGLGPGWRVEWSLVMPDGTTRMVAYEAMLVLRRLLPPATWADIFRREPSLDPTASTVIHSLTLTQLDTYLDEAWLQIESRLVGSGRRPDLVLSPHAFRETHILGTLALVYQSFVTRLKPAYAEIAGMYSRDRESAWTQIRFAQASPSDGKTVEGGAEPTRRGASTTVWLSSRGRGPTIPRNWP